MSDTDPPPYKNGDDDYGPQGPYRSTGDGQPPPPPGGWSSPGPPTGGGGGPSWSGGPSGPQYPPPSGPGEWSGGPAQGGQPSNTPVILYLIGGVLEIICCCLALPLLPFGLATVVLAAITLSKRSSGDFEGARKLERATWIVLAVGAVVAVLYFVLSLVFSFAPALFDDSFLNELESNSGE